MKRPLLSSLVAFMFISCPAQQFTLIKDINPGTSTSSICYLTNVDNKLFFAANDGVNGMELWKSDGTEAGTSLVKDINPGLSNSSIGYLTKVGHNVFFVANNGSAGAEIWKSDGTSEGTIMVKDLRGGIRGSNPSSLVSMNDQLYFSADDGIHGTELWTSDGTTAGTVMVKDINPFGPSYPTYLASIQDVLYFSASDGSSGTELWKTDGSSSGTLLVKDIWPGPEGSYPSNIINVNGKIYFSADDGNSGSELWKSDGSNSGTQMVKDIYSGSSSSYPSCLKNVDGRLFFCADNGSTGTELWISDGTSAGTNIVKDVWPGPESGAAGNFSILNNDLIFTGNDGVNGYKIWQSDGSLAGTKIATGLVDPGEGQMQELVETNTNIFASIGQANTGLELWGINYSAILPLTWLEFTANLIDGDGLLNWSTTNEYNTKDFIIERSTDGLAYKSIGKIDCEAGSRNHNYQFLDKRINKSTASTIYYRLKQNDLSQIFKYSKIVTISLNGREKSFIYLSPNMSEVTASIYNVKSRKVAYGLYDNTGRVIRKGSSNLQAGDNLLTLPIGSLSTGLYYLKLNNENFKQTHRFIKK